MIRFLPDLFLCRLTRIKRGVALHGIVYEVYTREKMYTQQTLISSYTTAIVYDFTSASPLPYREAGYFFS